MVNKFIISVATILGGATALNAQVYELGVGVEASGVSNTGIVVGVTGQNTHFMWTEGEGIVPIGTITSGDPLTISTRISADGKYIAGTMTNPDNNLDEMALYDVANDTWTYLGGLDSSNGANRSSVWNISSDGSAVVGLGWVSSGAGNGRAIKWTAQDGLVDLGSNVTGRSSRANDVSNNGVVVGWQDLDNGDRTAAYWINGEQRTILDESNTPLGEITGVSEDGNNMIVLSYPNPYVYNINTGLTEIVHPNPPAGDPFFTGYVRGISADGKTVIGNYYSFFTGPYMGEGFIWTEEGGYVNLNEYVQDLGYDDNGITFAIPMAISPDGKYITGMGRTGMAYVSFLIKLPQEEEGCLEAVWGQYPVETVIPGCLGFPQVVADVAFPGEYTLLQVTNGTEYIFSLTNPEYFITIGDETGTNVITSGTGSVTWTANFDGLVRFYSHRDSDCTWQGEGDGFSRLVQCGDLPPAPESCEEHEILSNDFENGLYLGGEDNQSAAVDIPVGAEGFTLYGFEPTLVGEATAISFILYEDADGLPGDQIEVIEGNIVGQELTYTEEGFDLYKYTVGFDSPVDLAANTTYWIEVVADAEGWEATTQSLIGIPGVYKNDLTGGEWESTGPGGPEFVYNLICGALGTSDIDKGHFSYYPNPVKDHLFIESEKSIQNVTVYNLAGQKVQGEMKALNGKVNMSGLTPGVYVLRVMLEGGSVETFKIIKE